MDYVIVENSDSKEVATGEQLDLLLAVGVLCQDEPRVDGGLPVVDGAIADYGCHSVLDKHIGRALLFDLTDDKELFCWHGAGKHGVFGRVRVGCPVDCAGHWVVNRVVVDEDGHAKDVHGHIGG